MGGKICQPQAEMTENKEDIQQLRKQLEKLEEAVRRIDRRVKSTLKTFIHERVT